MHPAIQALQRFDPSSDPLGGALRQRANDSTNNYYNEATSNPNMDPRLKGELLRQQVSSLQSNSGPQGFGTWLQALNESAPGGISGPKHEGDPLGGLPNAPFGQPSTIFDPQRQTALGDYVSAPGEKTGAISNPQSAVAVQALKRLQNAN